MGIRVSRLGLGLGAYLRNRSPVPEKKTTTAPRPEKTTQGQQGRRAAEEGQTGSTNSHNHRDLEGRKVEGEGRGREGGEHAGGGGSRSPKSGSMTAQWIRRGEATGCRRECERRLRRSGLESGEESIE